MTTVFYVRLVAAFAFGVLLKTSATPTAVQAASQRPAEFKQLMDQKAASLRKAWLASHVGLGLDTTTPQVTSAKFLTPTVDVLRAPAAPKVEVHYTTGSAGVAYVGVLVNAPIGPQQLFLVFNQTYGVPGPTSGYVDIQQPVSPSYLDLEAVGLYAPAGKWTVGSVEIGDAAGNQTVYDGPAASALFSTPYFTVVNHGTPDSRPPQVSQGAVLTKTVSLSNSPIFKIRLKASDDVSGIHYALVTVDFNGGYLDASSSLTAPVAAGNIITSGLLPAGFPTGTYTISDYYLCDVAGNCTLPATPTQLNSVFNGQLTFEVVP